MKYLYFILLVLMSVSCVVDAPIVDTDIIVNQPEEVLDTPCVLVPITNPEFVTLWIELDNGLSNNPYYTHSWMHGDTFNSVIDLLIARGFNSDSLEYYESDSAIAVIIKGTNDKYGIDAKIFTRDSIGIKHAFAAYVQYFTFAGAVNYEEYLSIAKRYPSCRSFDFRRCHWTQEQLEEVAWIILGECKEGRYKADFRFNDYPISDELYCLFIERGWEIVVGQIENCMEPLPFSIDKT